MISKCRDYSLLGRDGVVARKMDSPDQTGTKLRYHEIARRVDEAH